MFYRSAAMCFNKYSGREAAAVVDAPIAAAEASGEDKK
jgi:hypothetical protein